MAIPKGWTLETLSSVVIPDGLQTGPFGSQLKASEYATDGVPVIMPKDMKNGRVSTASIARIPEAVAESRLSPHRTQSGDLLFARRGEIGRCALITSQELGWVCGTGCLRARPGRKVHPAFLLHQILDAKATSWLTDMAVGQTMLNLNTQILSELPIALPPLPEQKKIAAVLSSVDAAIEKTEAVIAQLQVVKKAMMEQLLTKGLPGRHTRFKRLDKDWRIGRFRPFITEIPDDWSLVQIVNIAKLESGHTPSRHHPEYWEGNIPWVSLHDSKHLDGPVILNTAQTIGVLGLENSSARMLPMGTVVFSRTATVGKCTVLGRDMATSQDFANYVCGPDLDPRYLMHLMRNMQTEWKRLMAGSTHQTIYMPVFRDLQILLPPIKEQIEIAAIGDQFETIISTEHKTVSELRKLKSSLSSSLLSGELRVPTDSVPCPV